MSKFKNILSDVGSSLKDYSKSAWGSFVEEAKNEINRLSSEYLLQDKQVSILQNNLPYIQSSVDVVNGVDEASNNNGRKKFQYHFFYNGQVSDIVNHLQVRKSNLGEYKIQQRTNQKAVLSDPSNDLGHERSKYEYIDEDSIIRDNRRKQHKYVSDYLDDTSSDVNYRDNYKNNKFVNPNASVLGSGVRVSDTNASMAGGEFRYNEHEYGHDEYIAFIDHHYTSVNFLPSSTSSYKFNNSLVKKTNEWFEDSRKNEFKTINSRFHTLDDSDSISEIVGGVDNQAYTRYGLSRGRNLLKERPTYPHGYEDPYCRVWTWHYQYKSFVKDTIRPFTQIDHLTDLFEGGDGKYGWGNFRATNEGSLYAHGGMGKLQGYGSMYNRNGDTVGLVNISPQWNKGTTYKDQSNVGIRNCMFSIENLAWKGVFSGYDDETFSHGVKSEDLSIDQKGPLGGRIMWFPPYDISFNETSSAKWDENTFIGRGEPIYTYSNTTRNGTLHFKLLIDHPAILDYWEHRNEPNNLAFEGPEYTYGTDEENPEAAMLRFFAGCSILKVGQQREYTPDPPPPPKEDPPQNEKAFNFIVFYPNNYSGMDDKVGGEVDPIDYLINGVGAQLQSVSGNSVDIPTEITYNMYNGEVVGGYEMRSNHGISLVSQETTEDVFATVLHNFEDIDLVKQSMSEAEYKKALSKYETQLAAAKRKGVKCTATKPVQHKWYYRVDKNTAGQKLQDVSYADFSSSQLNSVNYTKGVDYYGLNDPTYSLTEVYVALKGDVGAVLTGLYDEERVAELKELFAGNKGKLTQIKCIGRASSQGNNKKTTTNNARNKQLAQHRAQTIQDWVQKYVSGTDLKYTQSTFDYDKTKDHNQLNSNDYDAKLNRMALVEVKYLPESTEDASETQVSIDSSGSPENNSSVVKNDNKDGNVGEIDKQTPIIITDSTINNRRYDNEAKFFQSIRKEDPFITRLLCDRIKYFDPAFHSVSPEGFNARLTFLQQCLRQGPTISGSDTMSENPNNLAFGRPPVCVLRIGDFYNTKIIITNMSINYDPLVWDLNQEGIGVMPMIADITLSFNFIGGQDLAGPIQRLQNALSFNYYANTGVYDDRSEEIHYEWGGEVTKFKPFNLNTTAYNSIIKDAEGDDLATSEQT